MTEGLRGCLSRAVTDTPVSPGSPTSRHFILGITALQYRMSRRCEVTY